MKIINFQHPALCIDHFKTGAGEAWCVFGENNSGIDCFIDLFSGSLTDYRADLLDLPAHSGTVSFRSQQQLFEEELRNDDSDYLDRIDPGTLVREFLPDHAAHVDLLNTFAMTHCLDLGYRQLSSGQARKLLLLRELISGTSHLVLQNPYDGLDEDSCRELDSALSGLSARGIELLVSVNILSDIPFWADHLAIIKNGRLVCSGARDQVLLFLNADHATRRSHDDWGISAFLQPAGNRRAGKEELVFLRQGFAAYGGKKLFSGLDLTIESGDHTLVTGRNGCGKSTLLDIITGDNPKCYANDLRIFGRKRGLGESIWDIKRQMGIISPTLHREHIISGSALHIVLSGLYDSIGLYRRAGSAEIKMARHWLAWLNLSSRADVPFRRLSFAEQRLILIARALIKSPKLLILDEPTQGLDDAHRNTLLDLLEKIACSRLSTILFVSHRRDEHRGFFHQQICLDAYAT